LFLYFKTNAVLKLVIFRLRVCQSFHFHTGTSVLCEYATAAYFAYCRIFHIFQQSVHVAYFSAKIGIFNGDSNTTCVSITYFYKVLLARPSGCQQNGTIHVSGPCGTKWVVGFKQFCTIFPHISVAYLVFMWSQYFFKGHIKTDTSVFMWICILDKHVPIQYTLLFDSHLCWLTMATVVSTSHGESCVGIQINEQTHVKEITKRCKIKCENAFKKDDVGRLYLMRALSTNKHPHFVT